MCRRKLVEAEENSHPPPSPATYHRLRELRKAFPKVIWVASHRDTWLAILALFGQLVPLIFVSVSGIYIWFVYAPFNDEFIKQIEEETPEFQEIKLDAKQRLETIFIVPMVGGLTAILITLIHMLAIFQRRTEYRTMFINQAACLLWSAVIALWFVFISSDLEKWPDDTFGLTDPLVNAYKHLLIDVFINKNNSQKQISRLNSAYECCGLDGPMDFFTEAGNIHSPFPKIVGNLTQIVPESCCLDAFPECFLQKSGADISMRGMRTMGCREAIHHPLMIQTRTTAVVAALGFFLIIVITFALYDILTAMKKKRASFERRRSTTNEYIKAELAKTEEEYYKL